MNNNLEEMLAELKIPKEFVGDFCETRSPLNYSFQCHVAERTLDLKRKSKVPSELIDEVYQDVFLAMQGMAGYIYLAGVQSNNDSDDYQRGYDAGYRERQEEDEDDVEFD